MRTVPFWIKCAEIIGTTIKFEVMKLKWPPILIEEYKLTISEECLMYLLHRGEAVGI